MAEAVLSSGKLFADLDILLAEVEKISALKKLLELARENQELPFKYAITEVREQIMVLHGLLDKIESDFQHYVEMRTTLKELQDTVKKEQKEAQYFLEALSSRSAWESCGFAQTEKHNESQQVKGKKPTKVSETEAFPDKADTMIQEDFEKVLGFAQTEKHNESQQVRVRKSTKASEIGFPREMLPLTPEDLEEIPVYMKGRVTCDQINAVVNNLNKAFMAKYKIRNQALRFMNTADRTLYYRYIEEENKDTEGCYFVVEEDIKLFTRVKVDKRFHQILIILRHCQRLKEIRTPGIIRYVIC